MRPLLQPLIHKILLIMRRTTSENYPKPPWSKNVADTLTSKKGSPPYPLIGSWTVTNQSLSDVKTYKSETGFLSVTPKPPKNNSCKYRLELLPDLKNDQRFKNPK